MADHDSVHLRERVKEKPSEDLVRYVNAPALERSLKVAFEPQMQIHLAHTVMLARQGIIGQDDARAILRVLSNLRAAGPSSIEIDPGLEDLYSHVERALIRIVGPDVGGRMHTGRSRNDLGVTQARLVLRNDLLDLLDRLLALQRVLLDLSAAHVETVMPGLTHSQHAQVITLGYYLAAFSDVVGRDLDRLEAAYDRVNRNPLGAAALTTTGFPLDRQLTTDLLAFDGLVENAYDAIVSRDDVPECASVIALLMTNLSRLAEDLWLWSTLEFGYVELADRYCAVSSIMPQKKNPGVLEKLKAMSAQAVGDAVATFAAVKNVSFSECGDAQDGGNAPLHSAISVASAAIDLYCGVLPTMTVKKERLRHLAAIGFATMTELADTIVREKGMSFRMAHNIVGKTVSDAVDTGLTAVDLTPEMLDVACQELFGHPLGLSPEALSRSLDPWGNIQVRTVTGGPAPVEMERMLQNAVSRLAAAGNRQQLRRDRIAAARQHLDQAVLVV
ncbi:MAG TPA: argininosuccinate lyase [Chloroflexota bacterium]|nr:argininosuccinate lyase [Chloroflexota bacterium]